MAANPSPAILPITNPQSGATTTDRQQSSSIAAIRAFFSGISVLSGLANCRPWPEVLDQSAFSKPESISDATLRIRKNYTYFRINYLTIITVVLVISLLTNPFSLILLTGLLAAWLFLYLFRRPENPPVTIFGRKFSPRETLIVLIVSTVVIIFLTSVGYVLVSAFMVGLAIVFVHGAFRVPEDLFLDEAEPQGGGFSFISMFRGGASPVSQPLPVAVRT